MDFIFNGQASGDVATALMQANGDPRSLRPYILNGVPHIARMINNQLVHVPTQNANAVLPYDTWKEIDKTVQAAARERLRAIADLRSRGLTRTIGNALGKTSLQTQNVSRSGEATVSMDPTRESERERPEFDLTNLPLPVIHKDFSFGIREIMASRNGEYTLDTSFAADCARGVAETAEKMLIGTNGNFLHGGGAIYGYTNFPSRITHTLSDPEDTGWKGGDLVKDILAMKAKSQAKLHYGPWMVYTSPYWDEFLDDDYSEVKGSNTLRQRIGAIDNIVGVNTLDNLTGKNILMVQMTSGVVQEVMGMDIMTIQWDELGGMRKHFKVMAIMVPLLRKDFNGNTGIVHGSVPA